METGSTDPFFIIGQGVFLVKVLVVSYSNRRVTLLINVLVVIRKRRKKRAELLDSVAPLFEIKCKLFNNLNGELVLMFMLKAW